MKGVLTVRNPSESDRIYDIDVMLNNTTNTNLAGDHVQVDELESRKEFSTKYKVKNSRMLVLRERLDTNPDRDQERSLSVSKGGEGGPLLLELEVENVSGVSLNEVVVSREMPSQLNMTATGGVEIEGSEEIEPIVVRIVSIGKAKPCFFLELIFFGKIFVDSSLSISLVWLWFSLCLLES